MKEPFSIVIVDDITILRQALKSLLSSQPDLKVVGEAGDGLEAIRSVQDHSPDLVLMDLCMPGITGLDAIIEIKRVSPQTKIIVLTLPSDEAYILSTLQVGVSGYVFKKCDSTELLTSIHHVLDGRHYVSPCISTAITDCLLRRKRAFLIRSDWETLSQRETEIVKLIAEGHRNNKIANLLGISVKTAEKHRCNIMKKLNVHSAVALSALAAEKGVINK
jgi:two-component system, NarL family, response regulator NreC